jgi:hypothetical protein
VTTRSLTGALPHAHTRSGSGVVTLMGSPWK